MLTQLYMMLILGCAAKKSSTEKAADWVGAGLVMGIAFVLAVAMVVVAYGALVLGADWTSTLITLIILIIITYVIFFLIDAFSKKTGQKYTAGFFGGIGFTIGLIIITLILSYWDIASSVTISGP